METFLTVFSCVENSPICSLIFSQSTKAWMSVAFLEGDGEEANNISCLLDVFLCPPIVFRVPEPYTEIQTNEDRA